MRRAGHAVSLAVLLAAIGFAASAQPARPSPPVAEVQVGIGLRLEAKANDYGRSDLDMLTKELKNDVERQLRRRGRLQPDGGRLMLTLTDATPDTSTQFGSNFELNSMRSTGLGSAVIDGVEIGPDGARRPIHFEHAQESEARLRASASVWGAAETAFDAFARDYAQGRR